MMRRSCVWWAAFAAAVMIAAGAPAATVTVNEGEDLAQAIADAADGDTLQLEGSGTGAVWPLTAPVGITKNLTILGDPGMLPDECVIEGNSAAGACPGNAVDNGDFESGPTPSWTPNPTTPPVIVQDPARAASGEWLAQFTLDPCVPQTPDLAPDQVELRYIHPTPVPGLPPVGPARVDWMTLPMPPPVLGTILTVWIKAHMPVAGNRLAVTLTDSGGIAGTAFIEDADLTAAADWLAVPLPLNTFVPALSPAETVMSLSIESQFTVGAPDDPPCALIGGVEFGAAAPALPTPSALNLGFALPGPGASLVELAAPFAGAPQALSLGGLVPPALRFSVRAETPQPGDKIELLPRPGEAALWSAASETLTGANCQSFSVPLTPGPSVMPVFRATIQPPAAVAGPVTRFVVDDLSLSTLGAWLLAQVKNGNLFLHGDMEDVGLTADQWSAATPCEILGPPLPASYFTGPGCGPSASALLLTREAGAPSVAELRQAVTFPASGDEIRFKLRVGQPGGADSIFTFDVDGTVLHTAESDDAALAAGWTDVIVPYPAAWHNTTKTLRFSAELTGGVAPPSFLIDDVCVGLPPAGPVLTVANTAKLRLENLTVSNGTTGVTVTDTASLAFVRCAAQSVSGAGLYFSSSGTGYASSSFFSGCGGPAVLSDSTGTVTVYQCTARSNLGGVQANAGNINLAVSLLDTGDAVGQVYTWLNLIRSDVFPAAYEQPGFENLDPATPVNFAGTPWGGKLDALNPVLSGHTITAGDPVLSLLPAAADRAYDFDGDERPSLEGEQIQVGADQEGGTVGAPVWLSCSVTPDVVGRGEPVTITVVTQGMDLGIASLRIVPEEPLAGMTELPDAYIPTQCYEIPLAGGMTDANTATVTVSFADPCDRRSVMDTPLCAEGINRIYLNDGTDNTNPVLYGDGMPGPTDPAFTSCSFLVDTTPPTLLFAASANGDAATAQPRVSANDSLIGTGVPGPQGAYAVPVSGGTIVDRALHFMLNPGGNGNCTDTAAGDTLSFGIEAVFEDRPPSPLTRVTTSGFQAGNATTFADKQDGQAWLEGPLGPVTNTSATYDTSGSAANIGRLTARFDGEASQSTPDPWRFEGKPAARDRAGNEITAPNGLVLWWMWRAQAEITSGPRDTQTLSPRFDWKLRRNIKGPDADEAAPIIPYVKARLWRGADPAADRDISTMSWVPVTGWSGWLSGPITPETVIDGAPLATALKQNQNEDSVSHTLMLTLVGADEAGNVQPGGLADGSLVTVADLAASCVSYTWWYNGQSQENVSVDTEARVTLWELAPGFADRPIGSVARVPLPPAANRLQARAVLTARLPETIRRAVAAGETSVARAWIKWVLYEDGNPVASGGDESNLLAGRDFVDLILPPDPTVADGLVLGDMKNRKREKRYVLTAQTVLKTFSYMGGVTQERVVSDPTPASVTFTVYPKEVDEKIRDERPTRIYERE